MGNSPPAVRERGQLLYINALADPVFAEVSELTRTILTEIDLAPTDWVT
jgi:hypothetical protein